MNQSCPCRRVRGRRIAAGGPGVLQWVDDAALVDAAQRQGVSIELLRAVGEFVPGGAPLALVHGDGPFDDSTLHEAVHLGRERSMDQDVGFGLRQLVDIAERALSPGVNDPTTAVQAIDHLHDLVRRLATRALPPRQHVTDDGHVVLSVPQPRFADYLALAFDEIVRWGEDSPRIQRRVHVALQDLEDVARPEHRPVVHAAIARHSGEGCPHRSTRCHRRTSGSAELLPTGEPSRPRCRQGVHGIRCWAGDGGRAGRRQRCGRPPITKETT